MVMTEEDFKETAKADQEIGINYIPGRVYIKIPNAKESLFNGLKVVTRNKNAEWLEDYNYIADWLTDNKGKSFVLTGPTGVGKSMICSAVIPMMLEKLCHRRVPVYTAKDLCNKETYLKAIKQKIVILDDFGVEDVFNDFGNIHDIFSEIVDNIEKKGVLLIGTTNLTPEEIKAKYGFRTYDRLRGNAKLVIIRHESMRG